jgi:6,7-dimethyl-8-ribityllumazine synthase
MKKIALVLGEFHKDLIEKMREQAHQSAKENNLEIIAEVWVPGSVEKPLAIKKLLLNPEIAGVAVLGIIEKGQTKHGFTMGQALMQTVMNLQLEFMKPVTLGVIGPDAEPQHIESRLLPYSKKSIDALTKVL